MQWPEMAAVTGLAHDSTMRITVCSVGSALALGVLNSRMSAPPEKRPFAPMSTMARMASSATAASMPSTMRLRKS